MLSLQSQLCAIRGAFHLCFKNKTNKKNKFIGLKCFIQCWFLSLHDPQTCGSKCLQLPTEHSAVTAPNHPEATVPTKTKKSKLISVFMVRGGMTEKDIKTPRKERKTKTRVEEKVKEGITSMHVCVPLSYRATQSHNQTVHQPVLRNLRC